MPKFTEPLELALAKPAEACAPIENHVKGKIVIVRRGSCPFVKKAENVEAAGGVVAVLGSTTPYLLRMVNIKHFIMIIYFQLNYGGVQGVEPRWKGLNTNIPVVMVSKRAYGYVIENYVIISERYQN